VAAADPVAALSQRGSALDEEEIIGKNEKEIKKPKDKDMM